MSVTVPRLHEGNTVEVESFGHRLLMGVQWIDAGSGRPAGGAGTTELEGIGSRPLRQTLIPHGQARHALLHRDRAAVLLAAGVQQNADTPPASPELDATNLALRGWAASRRYVPRRLALTPVLADGRPPATPANIRSAWLWPGADSPYPSNSTALRGRIRRGAGLATAPPVPWARVLVTRPAVVPDPLPPGLPQFDDEKLVGWAHGDDRGEFLAVLGAAALPGGVVLPSLLYLTVWVCLPPPTDLDPADPLASLPLEFAGSATDDPILEGRLPPATWVRQDGLRIQIRPGTTRVLADADLRFDP